MQCPYCDGSRVESLDAEHSEWYCNNCEDTFETESLEEREQGDEF